MLLSQVISLQSPFLTFACISGLALIFWLRLNRYKTIDSRHRAPRVPYWLPWIGSAIEMGKDPDAFFKRASSQLGPVFRVKAVGHEFNYITSPDLISAIYRDKKAFEFTPIRLEMSEKVFGTSHAATYSPHMEHEFLPFHIRALSPQNIGGLLQRYAESASRYVRETVSKLDGQSSPLVQLVVPPAYYSACYAFFGSAFPAEKSYQPFRTFDNQFHLLAAGVPKFMMPRPHSAWDQVGKMFEKYLKGPHGDCSDIVTGIESRAKDANWLASDIARTLGTELWALQANAINAAYWVLALALQKPRGLSALVAEVNSAKLYWTVQKSNESDMNEHQWLIDAPLPLLTSAIQEALRLSTSTFSIRRVHHPVDFAGFHFETGERIVCVTRAVHLDEEIHPKAAEFVAERYLKGQTKVSKDGKPAPNHSMPFGGGVSMCEGRHFAMGELKIYLGMILSYAIIELDSSSMSRPKLNTARMGVGVMTPVGDLRVKIRQRTDV